MCIGNEFSRSRKKCVSHPGFGKNPSRKRDKAQSALKATKVLREHTELVINFSLCYWQRVAFKAVAFRLSPTTELWYANCMCICTYVHGYAQAEAPTGLGTIMHELYFLR